MASPRKPSQGKYKPLIFNGYLTLVRFGAFFKDEVDLEFFAGSEPIRVFYNSDTEKYDLRIRGRAFTDLLEDSKYTIN